MKVSANSILKQKNIHFSTESTMTLGLSRTSHHEADSSDQQICTLKIQRIPFADDSSCEFVLPTGQLEQYYVTAKMLNPLDQRLIVSTIKVGSNISEWRKQPLQSAEMMGIKFKVVPEQPLFNSQVGEIHTIEFYWPISAKSTALIILSTRNDYTTLWHEIPPYNHDVNKRMKKQKIFTPIPELCHAEGCQLSLVIVTDRNALQYLIDAKIPVSVLFNYENPQIFKFSSFIPGALRPRHQENNNNHQLDIKITPQFEIYSPRDNVSVSIEILTANKLISSQKAVLQKEKEEEEEEEEIELAIWVVDKAVEDYEKNPINTNNLFPSFYTYKHQASITAPPRTPLISSTLETLNSKRVYETTRSILERRLKEDPHVQEFWNLQYNDGTFDQSDQNFFHNYYSYLTYHPVGGNRGFGFVGRNELFGGSIEFGVAKRSLDERPVTMMATLATPATTTQKLVVRTKFLKTVIFKTFTFPVSCKAQQKHRTKETPSKKRKMTIDFTLPDNLGSFIIRVVAASTKKAGAAEASIVVNQNLMMFPVFPKFVRQGDHFKGGTAANVINNTFAGNYQFTIIPSNNDIVLSLPKSDSHYGNTFQVKIGVDPTQQLMMMSAKVPTGETKFTMSLVSKIASDALAIKLPIVEELQTNYLVSSFALDGNETRREGIASLANAGSVANGKLQFSASFGHLSAILDMSQRLIKENPLLPIIINQMQGTCLPSYYLSYLIPYVMFKLYGNLSSAVLAAKTKLEAKKDFLDAISNLRRCTDSYFGLQNGWLGTEAKTFNGQMNLQALFLTSIIIESELGMHLSNIKDLQRQWKMATLTQLEEQKAMADEDRNLFVLAYFVLGSQVVQPMTTANSTTWKALLQQQKSLSLTSRICLALMNPTMTSYFTKLIDQMRLTSRSAYLSQDGAGYGKADEFASYLMLRLIFAQKTTFYDVPDITMRFINDFIYRFNPESSSCNYDILALQYYDHQKRQLPITTTTTTTKDAEIDLSIMLNPNRTITKVLSEDENSVMTFQCPLNQTSKIVTLESQGIGELSVLMTLSYPQRLSNTKATFHGISVDKVIKNTMVQIATGNELVAIGKAVTELKVGSLVKVIVQVYSPDIIQNLIVIDPLPACIEPQQTTNNLRYHSSNMEIATDKVIFFVNGGSGVMTFEYLAVVITEGIFDVPSTKAFLTSQPEVFGLSSSFKINVNTK